MEKPEDRDLLFEIDKELEAEFTELCGTYGVKCEEVLPGEGATRSVGPIFDLIHFVNENYDTLRDIRLLLQYSKLAWDGVRHVSKLRAAGKPEGGPPVTSDNRSYRVHEEAAKVRELEEAWDRKYGGTVVVQDRGGVYRELRRPDLPYSRVDVCVRTSYLAIDAPDLIVDAASREKFVHDRVIGALPGKGGLKGLQWRLHTEGDVTTDLRYA